MTRTRANNVSSNNENTETLGEFFKTLGAMTQMMKDYMTPSAASAPGQDDSGLIERFRRLGPSAFSRHGGVEKAKQWRRQVEKIFEVLHCSDEQKVRLETFMLEEDAKHWWSSVRRSWEETETEATWESFLVAFNQKYFPDSVRERKEVEFIQLQQGKLSVEQYAAKFAELSCYAPHVINIEARKASKFERGLRSDIGGRVISANLKMFSPLVGVDMKFERDCEEFCLRKEGKVRSAPFGSFGRRIRPPPRRDFRG
ncbi:uncharacterized protein LOC110007652 [Amborella trichopoda]|uniref:uncharacterized protein LOC110007652 n=1 Tax=Amborella trichopoda TaxID=13333 RepID=UPI0009BEBC74|nr:uncharacterized protein LOC110007652 [Amborella trichopoda]|eukprot:XP_020525722.1 uncharacterized protein LOC110007652 [Amborella trichopoda]